MKSPTPRDARRGILVLLLLLFACSWPDPARAQSAPPYDLELVEVWIQGDVMPEQAWKRYLSKAGISFQMDAPTEARLRNAGAGDEWIAVLRRATFHPPRQAVLAQPRRSFSRTDLRPLYFGNETRVTAYANLLRLRETGGEVQGYVINTPRGPAQLQSVPLPREAFSYGLVIDYASVGLDLEGSFHRDMLMLNVGAVYSPFLPIGTTGVRALVNVKPFIGITRQTLAHFPKQSFDKTEPVVDVLNWTYGGEVSAGLAYHWRPGRWLYGEIGYRTTGIWSRDLRAPDQEDITEGIPWSNWAAKGVTVRFGIGF